MTDPFVYAFSDLDFCEHDPALRQGPRSLLLCKGPDFKKNYVAIEEWLSQKQKTKFNKKIVEEEADMLLDQSPEGVFLVAGNTTILREFNQKFQAARFYFDDEV